VTWTTDTLTSAFSPSLNLVHITQLAAKWLLVFVFYSFNPMPVILQWCDPPQLNWPLKAVKGSSELQRPEEGVMHSRRYKPHLCSNR
jgi:hypothetical protein